MPDTEPKKPATVNREELYAQVWAIPMRRLATQYGLSDNGLAKVCRRLDVPYPARGHWARKAAGKKVNQTPLPAVRQGTPTQVTITPSVPAPPPPQMSPELQEAIAAARRLTAGLRVPSRLIHPHRVVAGWINERERWFEQNKRDSWGRGAHLPALTTLERRQHRILSTLFIALEKHGYTAKVDERGRALVEIDREPVLFTLKEKYRQVRQPLTEEEKRGLNQKRPWKREMQPTGLLQLSTETRLHPALAHSWIDTPDQPLEQQLPEIAAVFIAAAPILRERRRRYEEAERQRREEETRRYEVRQKQLRDRNRLRGFLELASRWRQVEDARLFLDALATRSADNSTKIVGDLNLGEWIAWARERLTAYNPLEAGAASVFEAIQDIDQWTYRED